MQVLLTTCGGWYLPQTAQAFARRQALGGLWVSGKPGVTIPPELFRRSWLFHLPMKPLYHLASQIVCERAFYAFFPFWKIWINRQLRRRNNPRFDVVHAIMGYATEPFDHAERIGALKVIDCPNSHPTSYRGYWQRECDLWCPGERVPIPDWFFARMNRELDRADVVVCPSNFVRDTMVTNGVPSDKCFINPFGVDTKVFRPRDTVPEKPRFISVGTVCVRKGHQYLFRAFQQVKQAIPDAELICCGGMKHDFRKERTKWEGTFTDIINMSHQDLAMLLRQCTAFVLTSVEEGFARVLSEAMAAGLPIIASYETGATTLVQDGVQGLIVRPRDPDHIAQAMLRLARDRALNQRMGQAAYEAGAKANTWQDYGDRLLAEYERRLAER